MRRYTSSLPLVAAHLVASGSCSCSAFVGSGRSAVLQKTRLCGKRWRYDSPLENHIRVDDDNDVPDGGNYSSGRRQSSVNDGKPHGYRDDQAVMEMPNNVYIDGEFHGSADNPRRKKSNELDPPEAYQILGLKDGCTDKATIKKAYYDLVAKYHPDHNKWNDEEQREAREKLYKINAAFACIKSALQKRPKLRPGFGTPGMATGGGGNWYDDNRDNSSYFGY